jgi:putative transposase
VSDDQHRRSVRLSNYDYAQAGAYFVTICTHARRLFFERGTVREIAERCWLEIPRHFLIVTLDEWVIMPNHVHGIIVITNSNNERDDLNAPHRRGVQLNAPTVSRDPANRHSLISPHRNTLAVIVRTYKAAVTTFCRKEGHSDFQWQRNYYEHIIRDAAELNRTRQYIMDNPTHWNQDEHHPHH